MSESPTLYQQRPDLYDLMHAEYVDDVRFLRDFVQTLGDRPRVLELGCGTGRLLSAILETGALATGVDSEPAMLDVARRRLSRYATQLTLQQGDMREVVLDRRQDLVVMGLNTFMHLLTTGDQVRALERIHSVLRPGGILMLDLPNPHTVLRDLQLGVLQHRFTVNSGGSDEGAITLWSVASASPASQLIHTRLFFDELEQGTHNLKRTTAEVTLRLTYRYELELLLSRTGYASIHLYGDYDSTPYEDEAERMLAIAAALA